MEKNIKQWKRREKKIDQTRMVHIPTTKIVSSGSLLVVLKGNSNIEKSFIITPNMN